MLKRVLGNEQCLQVILVGPTWHSFEKFMHNQDRDGCRRLLLKTTSIPLPDWLREVETRLHLRRASYNEAHVQKAKSEKIRVQRSCASVPTATLVYKKPEAADTNRMESSNHDSQNVESIYIGRSSDVIPRNRAGQRVDPPIKFNKVLRLQMSREKWCSNHQLKGVCPFAVCEFKHDLLDEAGRNALLSLARGNPCRRGNSCNEKDCYAGHHCPYNPCQKGKDCSFSKQHIDMHVHDKQIVNM